MATEEPRLTAPYIIEGQEEPELAHSEGLNKMAAIIQLSVRSRTLTDPDTQGSPTVDAFSDGDIYLVPASGAGNFSGQDDNIAAFYDGWIFMTPNEGWRCYVEDENRTVIYQDGAWVDYVPTAGLVESLGGHIDDPTTKTYVLDESAAYGYDIDTMIGVCASGDVTVILFIAGVNVGGITNHNFTESQSTATADSASPEDRSVFAGDRVTMEITSGSPNPLDFSFTLKTTRH